MSHIQEKSGKAATVVTQHAVHEERDVQARSTICGLRKALFLWILAIIVLTGCLAVGLGVGLSQKSRNGTQDNQTTATPVSVIGSSTSFSAVASNTQTSMFQSIITQTTSAPATSGTASTNCPSTNGSTYSASGHTYLILCQNDIQAPSKVDLGRHYKPTFNDCIDSCAILGANRSDISAVYWVDYELAQSGTCWCFGNTSRDDGAYVSTWAANNLAWIQS